MTLTTPVTELVSTAAVNSIDQLIEICLATCPSPNTKRMYGLEMRSFIQSGLPLNREGVGWYIQAKREDGNSHSALSMAISAIRKLASEAQMRNLISYQTYANIKSIKAGKYAPRRTGMWLTIEQARQLLAAPDRTTYWGKRDAAILSLMIGCGLRREEMATLPWECYQPRDGRPCLVDFLGKGDKRRTAPVPLWARADVDIWNYTLQREVRKANGQKVTNPALVANGLGADGIIRLIVRYGNLIGVTITPHDLRRTLAQMLRRNGAPLEQIQHMLGHERLETTNRYLGSFLELAPGAAAVDQLNLEVSR